MEPDRFDHCRTFADMLAVSGVVQPWAVKHREFEAWCREHGRVPPKQQRFRKWCNGDRNPEADQLVSVCDWLGWDAAARALALRLLGAHRAARRTSAAV